MRKVLLLFLVVIAILLVLPHPAQTTTSTLTGTITDAQGNPVNGTLIMQLPVPAQDTTTNKAVANTPVSFRVVNGVITGGAPLYDVANLQPQNLYYSARVYDSSGTLVFTGNYAVTGASYNLGAAVPTNVTTSNISYVAPAVTNAPNVFCCTQTFQGQIVSSLATGTAPFSIASTTLVPNLNISNLNGVTVSGTPAVGQALLANTSSAASWQNIPVQLSAFPNNGAVGTGTNLLAKLTGAPSTVTPTAITDTGGAVGICSSGCGNTGTAQVTTVGQASCVFDGATTAGDYVQISATVGGNCHDSGASYPSSGQVLGRVLSTNGAGGTFNMALFGVEVKGVTPSVTLSVFSNTTIATTTINSTNTTIATRSVTMPSSGCPCRVFLSYSLYLDFTGITNQPNIDFWISDGTNTMAGVQTGQSNAASGAKTSAAYGGFSTVTYSNGANVTFTLTGIQAGTAGATVQGAPASGSGPSSSFQVAVVSSN